MQNLRSQGFDSQLLRHLMVLSIGFTDLLSPYNRIGSPENLDEVAIVHTVLFFLIDVAKPSSDVPLFSAQWKDMSQEQTNIHVYPDWAAMQAYYGPRVAIPPYFNSAVASGHPPYPYMWAPPQHMMPPYGPAYAAIYSPGGVYAHPAVSFGSQSHGHGVPASPAVSDFLVATPLNTETPAKSPANSDRGLMKKLKGFDGLAMSIGNGNAESAEGGANSQSAQNEGSCDGSDGNTAGTSQNGRKRSREGTPATGGDGKTQSQKTGIEVNGTPEKASGMTVAPNGTGKVAGTAVPSGMSTALELKSPTCISSKPNAVSTPQPCANEKELKRERRKQSNRESARRSRLRKQAETEELAMKVESLTSDNMALKSEISRLTENSEKLRLENTALMRGSNLQEKLKAAQQGQTKEIISSNTDDKRVHPVSTENLLSRVNNSGAIDRNAEVEGDVYEKNSNSGVKLRQLLDTSTRADAVPAG
ncbi:G-box binding protein, multifunctional mosaic region [Dillenia turbinata]|uniref:G-box binding protein, multifunctional mosaic region n=1 Tax=Dillenia turbinata TaxID=194707 RepID=A0AAN8V302_9MAGN